MFAHHNCLHNQLVSFHNRVGGRVPEATPDAARRLKRYMVRLAASTSTVIPWSLERVVETYHGSKRKTYEEAAHEYRAHGLTKTQANVKMFIKREKIRFDHNKPNPDPRAIQYRNPVFAVVFAQYIKAIEDVVYRLRGNRLNKLPRTMVFGKSLNSYQRASLLVEKCNNFSRPVKLMIDASRFDQHLKIPHLQALHAAYLVWIKDDYFEMLLSWMMVNKVTSSKRLKYTVEGGRMSGDMDTSLGACLWMLSMTALYFDDKTLKWDCLCDGDDITVIVEYEDYERVMRELPPHYFSLGQEIKIEEPAFEIEKVTWCQANPINLGGVWRFVRHPAKVLSGALVGPKWSQMRNERSRRALANTIGLGEAHMNLGVPVLQAFAQAIIRCAKTEKQVRLDYNDRMLYKVSRELGKTWLKRLPSVEPKPVTDEARLSFALAYDISITEQLQYEQYFETWEINFGEPLLQPSPVDVATWSWEANDVERY